MVIHQAIMILFKWIKRFYTTLNRNPTFVPDIFCEQKQNYALITLETHNYRIIISNVLFKKVLVE